MQIAAVPHYRLLKLQAVVLMVIGRRPYALQRLAHMLRLRPADKYAIASLAHLQAEQLDFEAAIASLQQLMDRPWYGLGLALMYQQQCHEAAEALRKNTVLQPMSPYGWYRLAEVWLALDQPDEAQKTLSHLRQFEPAVAAQLEYYCRTFFTVPKALDGTH